MKKLNEITCCFVDHGLYLPLAHKLAASYGRVLYHTPWEKGFPQVNDCILGDGFEDLQRCDDFYEHLQEIDLFVFPDIGFQGLQYHLRDMGIPVWGSFGGTHIERDREYFMSLLDQCGLQVPKYYPVTGVSALREYLKDKEDKYIKISRYRGTMETWHWRNYDEDGGEIDSLAVQLGGWKELVVFLVFEPIETDIEIGGDTLFTGKFPKHMLEAYEWKDKGAFGAYKPREEMAEPIRQVMECFEPILEQADYRNLFSMEIRVKGDEFWFTDPCCRGPMPMTCSQVSLYKNLAEVIWAGAHGAKVEPEPEGKFTCECVLKAKVQKDHWTSIRPPDELADSMFINYCGKVGNVITLPPDDMRENIIGWLASHGDTPKETIELQLERAKLVPDGVEVCTDSLVELLKEIEKADQEGMPLTNEAMPEPAEIVEEK